MDTDCKQTVSATGQSRFPALLAWLAIDGRFRLVAYGRHFTMMQALCFIKIWDDDKLKTQPPGQENEHKRPIVLQFAYSKRS